MLVTQALREDLSELLEAWLQLPLLVGQELGSVQDLSEPLISNALVVQVPEVTSTKIESKL